MGSSNRLEKFRAVHALRRGGDPGSTAPVGYTDPGGTTRTFSGNEKSAYVWSPPFADPLQTIYRDRTMRELFQENNGFHRFPLPDPSTLVPTYTYGTCFPPIDVADYRIITIVVQLQTRSPELSLEMIPIVSWDVLPNTSTNATQQPDLAFTPIGFVNPDVTSAEIEFRTFQPYEATIPPEQNKTAPFSCRTVEPMCLRTKPNADTGPAPAPEGWTQFAFDFEVSSHRSFTLSVVPRVNGLAEAPPPGTLTLYYTRRT